MQRDNGVVIPRCRTGRPTFRGVVRLPLIVGAGLALIIAAILPIHRSHASGSGGTSRDPFNIRWHVIEPTPISSVNARIDQCIACRIFGSSSGSIGIWPALVLTWNRCRLPNGCRPDADAGSPD
jgi:hypothetical protein